MTTDHEGAPLLAPRRDGMPDDGRPDEKMPCVREFVRAVSMVRVRVASGPRDNSFTFSLRRIRFSIISCAPRGKVHHVV